MLLKAAHRVTITGRMNLIRDALIHAPVVVDVTVVSDHLPGSAQWYTLALAHPALALTTSHLDTGGLTFHSRQH